jgi:hypothetical protein
MGPVDPLHTIGKWLAGLYALLAGVVFLVLAGVILAPVVHHALQSFHLQAEDRNPTSRIEQVRLHNPFYSRQPCARVASRDDVAANEQWYLDCSGS